MANENDENIHLTGGWGKGYISNGAFAEYRVYSLQANSWSKGPNLKVARHVHGSTILNEKLYVFAGMDETDQCINSLEVLELNAVSKAWTLLVLEIIPARACPLICPINEKELLIMGGTYKAEEEGG